MKRRTKASKSRTYLTYDLGGTKLATAAVTWRGKILKEIRVSVDLSRGPAGLIEQMAKNGKAILSEYPDIRVAGIASAGPLDPHRGVLLNPTNLKTKGRYWGEIKIGAKLRASLKIPVILENDAAAAALGENWIGVARNIDNVVMFTLGTGIGTSVICNGKLVRAGRGLHTEGGHLILDRNEKKIRCGCGNFGDIEGYLSGANFGRWAGKKYFSRILTGSQISELAEQQDRRAIVAFEEYSKILALALQDFVVLFAPEIVVFAGSFSLASRFFLKSTKKHLETLLSSRRVGIDMMPMLRNSSLENDSGLIGAARVAMLSEKT